MRQRACLWKGQLRRLTAWRAEEGHADSLKPLPYTYSCSWLSWLCRTRSACSAPRPPAPSCCLWRHLRPTRRSGAPPAARACAPGARRAGMRGGQVGGKCLQARTADWWPVTLHPSHTSLMLHASRRHAPRPRWRPRAALQLQTCRPWPSSTGGSAALGAGDSVSIHEAGSCGGSGAVLP